MEVVYRPVRRRRVAAGRVVASVCALAAAGVVCTAAAFNVDGPRLVSAAQVSAVHAPAAHAADPVSQLGTRAAVSSSSSKARSTVLRRLVRVPDRVARVVVRHTVVRVARHVVRRTLVPRAFRRWWW